MRACCRLPEAGVLLKDAVDRKTKQAARDKAMWAGAFAKNAQQQKEDKQAAGASTPDGKTAAAGGKRVTFASPAGSATPAADAASPSTAADAGSPPRALFAGATPHPAGKKSASRLSSGKSLDGDDAAEAGVSAAAAAGASDGDGSSGGLTWGKVLGGVAVAAAVGIGAYFGYKHFAGSSSSRSLGGRSGGVRGAR